MTWLRRIIKNQWIDEQRRKSKIEYVNLNEETADEAEFVTKIENKDMANSILEILHQLPAGTRTQK